MENKELDNNKVNKKYPLSSGFPCMNNNCIKCCIETRMPISLFDIKSITNEGYKFKNFVVKRGRERFLKNIKGQCIFLKEKECTIYYFRPEGCRLYPLIFYKNSGNVALHDYCPNKKEFKYNEEDIKRLTLLLKEL